MERNVFVESSMFFKIENVPDVITDKECLEIFDETVTLTKRHTLDFSELKIGGIIRS